MLDRFQQKAIRKTIAKRVAAKQVQPSFAPIKSVLLVLNNENVGAKNAFSSLHDNLGVAKQEVHVLEYIGKLAKGEEPATNQILKKDFGMHGNIKRNPKPEALAANYDLVIGYYHATNVYLDRVLAEFNSAFIVGAQGVDSQLADLLISSKPEDHHIFIAELCKYLQVLQLTLHAK